MTDQPDYSQPNYIYRARVVSIYDADTMRLDIDLGLNVWVANEPIRIMGIDAPEVRGEEKEAGIVARDFLREMLPAGTMVTIETFKDRKGKYGRWLAAVYYPPVGNVAAALVQNGHAVWKEY